MIFFPKPMSDASHNRRRFLALGAGLAALSACKKDVPSEIGAGVRAYGERSPMEKAVREVRESITPGTGATRTPLQDLEGIITPSSLHFERHHSGVPSIDRATHEILLHGLVEQPLVFTMDDLRTLPSVSQIHFIECSGNSGAEQAGNPQPDPQTSAGLLSCSEWTGVPLSLLLKAVRLKPEAKWIIAEGADVCRMARSIPIEKALDDVLVAYAQNGEALRPEQGYPVRLLVPGWEGNINIKWLHRLHVVDQPAMTRDETSHYTDLMPDGKARIFTFMMEAKSIITRPAGGQKLAHGPGMYQITGMAWSGRGKVQRVEVSTDNGQTWVDAELQTPVLPKAVTRFRLPWQWNGKATSLQSRCTDETGYLQPSLDQLVEVRGRHSQYHCNAIKPWYVHDDGSVSHV
jgi:sulfane dehydrogenase subunit SoxC